MPSRRHADPVGALNDTIKGMATTGREPQWGTYASGSPPTVTLDTGQVIPDPATFCGTPDNGARVLVFFLQNGHDVATVPVEASEPPGQEGS